MVPYSSPSPPAEERTSQTTESASGGHGPEGLTRASKGNSARGATGLEGTEVMVTPTVQSPDPRATKKVPSVSWSGSLKLSARMRTETGSAPVLGAVYLPVRAPISPDPSTILHSTSSTSATPSQSPSCKTSALKSNEFPNPIPSSGGKGSINLTPVIRHSPATGGSPTSVAPPVNCTHPPTASPHAQPENTLSPFMVARNASSSKTLGRIKPPSFMNPLQFFPVPPSATLGSASPKHTP